VKRKWKILLIVSCLLAIGIGVYASTVYSRRGIVTVQTGRVVRQDLASIVTASGEIKPRNYINIGTNAPGAAPISEILVKEGQRVRKGQLLARLEDIQPLADVTAQKAALASSEADSTASEASLKASDENIRTQQALIERAKADLEHARIEFDRGKDLLNEQLIARQDYDSRKATYDAAVAALNEAQTRVVQARAQREQAAAQLAGSQKRVAQSKAMLTRFTDVRARYDITAPLDGVITNLPVRAGETVVPGIQNSAASTIMTIADMSLITAEVKVDETDIVNVKLDQLADVTIDAIPNKIFKGHVIEIGNTAILRSTGVAASQSTTSSQEAKDFKVVIALDDPPEDIRPGLSCSSKVTTATRQKVLTIPIQSLTIRQKGDLEPKPKNSGGAQAATRPDPAAEKARKEEIQGVFVISGGKAVFRKVETGITGATDIEISGGLQEGDEIITGSYQIIRTIRNDAQVKVDNKSPGQKA
jgi:HlyD family secretion protein